MTLIGSYKFYKRPTTEKENAAAIANPAHPLFWSRRHLHFPATPIKTLMESQTEFTCVTRDRHFLGEGRFVQLRLVRKRGKWKATPVSTPLEQGPNYAEKLCFGCGSYSHCVQIQLDANDENECWVCRTCISPDLIQ